MIDAVFVYGTLKRGQEREPCWPRAPRAVIRAKTKGRLHDLGPYPALIPGDDWIAGEVWLMAAEDVAATLRVLDEVECFGVDDVDLYVRREVECWTLLDGVRLRSYTYFLADESAARRSPRVEAGEMGWAEWFARR